jgi:putative glutamine amidotransferase
MKPVIGITPDIGATTPRPGRPASPRYDLKVAYADAVVAAGGLPIVLPYADDVDAALALCHALVITGGAFDIPAELYGEKSGQGMGEIKPGRTAFEQRILRAALRKDVPVLGVCGGMQLLAVECGGRLFQDIRTEVPGALDHEQKHDPGEPDHAAIVTEGSELHRIVGARDLRVNSTHHQAVKDAGKARVSAVAPDGIVEAIELPGKRAIGVEWHPELLAASEHLALYRALVEWARR